MGELSSSSDLSGSSPLLSLRRQDSTPAQEVLLMRQNTEETRRRKAQAQREEVRRTHGTDVWRASLAVCAYMSLTTFMYTIQYTHAH
jgi:hypothetical protein